MKVSIARTFFAAASIILWIYTKDIFPLLAIPLFLIENEWINIVGYFVLYFSAMKYGWSGYVLMMIPAVLLDKRTYYASLILWTLTDIITTIYFTSLGIAIEANPIVKSILLTSPVTFVALKIIVLSMAVVTIEAAPKEYKKGITLVMAIFMFLPAGMNSNILINYVIHQ